MTTEPSGAGLSPVPEAAIGGRRVELHRTSGQRGRGFALAFTTMVLWAILPIALAGVLAALDPMTITWARFVASALLLGAVLALRGNLPPLHRLDRTGVLLGAVATLFLAANYATYLLGLHWTSPADAQVLIQAGPILLSLGGIFVFRERFTALQWSGLGVLVVGLAIFLGGRLAEVRDASVRLPQGAAMIGVAAATWAIYGLAQKQLLREWSSTHVLLAVYAGCAIAFSALAEPRALLTLDAREAALLAFCALNTVVAYGAFAESLAHWEASRVGAVLALTPLVTLALAAAIDALLPGSEVGQTLSPRSWFGAGLVVAGSLAASLGAERAAQ